MTEKVFKWLKKNNNFESVAAAMRGPDSRDARLKTALTAPLRWTVGYNQGEYDTPFEETFELLKRVMLEPCYKISELDGHYLQHIREAYVALRNGGYEMSRIPLTVYLETPQVQKHYGEELRRRSLRDICCEDMLKILKKVKRAKFVPIKLPNYSSNVPHSFCGE